MGKRLKNKFLYTLISFIILTFTLLSSKSYATMFNRRWVHGEISAGGSGSYYWAWDQFCSFLGCGFGVPESDSELRKNNLDNLHASPDMALILSSLNNMDYTPASLYSSAYEGFCQLGFGKTGGGYSAFQWAVWSNSEGTPYGTSDEINWSDVFNGSLSSDSQGTTDEMTDLLGAASTQISSSNNSSDSNLQGAYSIQIGNEPECWEVNNNTLTVKGKIYNCPQDAENKLKDYVLNIFYEDDSKNINGIKINNIIINGNDITLNCSYTGNNPSSDKPIFACISTEDPGDGNASATVQSSLTVGNASLLNVANEYNSFVAGLCEQGNGIHLQTVTGPDGIEYQFPEISKDKLFDAKFDDMEAYFDQVKNEYVVGPIRVHGTMFGKKSSSGLDFSVFDGFEINTNVGKASYNSRFEKNVDDTVIYDDEGYATLYLAIPYEEGMKEISKISVNYKYLIAVANFKHYTCGEGQDQIVVKNAARWYEEISVETKMNYPLPYYLKIEKEFLNETDTNNIDYFAKDRGEQASKIVDINSSKSIVFNNLAKFNPKTEFLLKKLDENGNVTDEILEFNGDTSLLPVMKLLDDNGNEVESKRWAFKYNDGEYVNYTNDYKTYLENTHNADIEIEYLGNIQNPRLKVEYYNQHWTGIIKTDANGKWDLDDDGNVQYIKNEIEFSKEESTYNSISVENIMPYTKYIHIDYHTFPNHTDSEGIINDKYEFKLMYGTKEVTDWSFGWEQTFGTDTNKYSLYIPANSQLFSSVKPTNGIYYGNLVIFLNNVDAVDGNEYELIIVPKESLYLSQEDVSNVLGKDNDTFYFQVDINYNNGDPIETHILETKANDSVTVGPLYARGDKEPTYKVYELDEEKNIIKNRRVDSNWNLITILNQEGKLKEGDTVNVLAINKLESHTGKIRIKKVTDIPVEKDTTFKFRLKVIDKDGNEIKDKGETLSKLNGIIELTVNKGAKQALSDEYSYVWYGDTAPTYILEEVEIPSDYVAETQLPITGILEESEKVLFGDVNSNGTLDEEDARLILQYSIGNTNIFNDEQKKIADVDKDTEITAEDAIKILRWIGDLPVNVTFLDRIPIDIQVVNRKTEIKPVSLTLRKEIEGNIPTDDTFDFWIWTTGATNNLGGSADKAVPIMGLKPGVDYPFTFYPESKDTPVEYHITENVPANWEFKSFEVSQDGEIVKTTDQSTVDATVDGSLKEGTSIKVIATNKQNQSNSGSIIIDKIFDEEQPSDKNRIVKFDVKIEVPEEFEFSEVPTINNEALFEKKTLDDGKTYYVLKHPAEINVAAGQSQSFTWEKDANGWHYKSSIDSWIKGDHGEWINNNTNSIKLGDFSWIGDYGDKIKYHVDEVQVLEENPSDGKITDVTEEYAAKIDNPTGTLGGEVKITATNKKNVEHKNVIKLTKKRAGITDGVETFIFKLTVGNETEYVALRAEQGHEEVTKYKIIDSADANIDDGEWLNTTNGTWTSDEYTWLESEEIPEYTIEEVKVIADRTYTPVITPNDGKGRLDGSKAEIDVQAMNYSNDDKHNEQSLKVKKVFSSDSQKVNQKAIITFDVDVSAPSYSTTEGYISEFTDWPSDFKEDASLLNGVRHYKAQKTLNVDLNTLNDVTADWGTFKWNENVSIKDYNLVDNVKISEVSIADENGNPIVDEDGNPRYPLESITPKLDENGFYFEIKNGWNDGGDIPHYASLTIDKELSDKGSQDLNKEFTFDVNVTGGITSAVIENAKEETVDGETYIVKSEGDNLEITDLLGQFNKMIKISPKEKMTIDFTYKGDTAPTFTVSESESTEYKIESITSTAKDSVTDGNKVSGTLNESADVTVTATNELKIHDHLSITKMLAEPADDVEYFVFKINIDGETKYAGIKVEKDGKTGTQHATLSSDSVDDLKKATWTEDGKWTSEEYYWFVDEEGPKYTIEEVKAYKGSNYKDISALYNPQMAPSNSGMLNGDTALETKVDILNTVDHGSGSLTLKKVLSGNVPVTDSFNFEITIEPDGKQLELVGANSEGKIVENVKVAPDEEISKTYNWIYTGSDKTATPKFTIKEKDLPDGVTLESFSEGFERIEENGKLVGISGHLKKNDEASENAKQGLEITAENTVNEKSGKIQVTKNFTNNKQVTLGNVKDWATKNKSEFKAKVVVTAAPNGKLIDEKVDSDGNVSRTFCTEKTINLKMTSSNNWTDTTENIYWTGGNPTFTVQEVDLPAQWEYVSSRLDNQSEETDNYLEGKLVENKTENATITNQPTGVIVLCMELGGMVWEDIPISSDDKNVSNISTTNGVYDGVNDKLKENIEVNIYKVFKEKSTGTQYSTLFKTTRTGKDGKWSINQIGVPAIGTKDYVDVIELKSGEDYDVYYNVEFVYDGQTYKASEPLKYLTKNGNTITGAEKGNIEDFRANRDKYSNSSMAKEYESNSSTISEVKDNSVITDDGTTYGIVKQGNKETTIMYKKTKNGYPVESKLQTTYGDNEYVYDIFKAKASTQATGLRYPFEEHMSLNNSDHVIFLSAVGETDDNIVEIDVNGNNDYKLFTTNYVEVSKANAGDGTYYLKNNNGNLIMDTAGFIYRRENGLYFVVHKTNGVYTMNKSENFIIAETYKSLYNYCKNINLGLERKPDLDIALTKKLTSVDVVVKEKLYKFPYSKYYDFTEEKTDKLRQNIIVNGVEQIVPLEVGLYKSDYNYRAEIYENGGKAYDALTKLYKKFNKTIDDTEMDIYLNYEIKVQNTSSDYTVRINSIDDYYDESLTLLRKNETKVIDGKEEVVANASGYSDKWTDVEKGIKGSDDITYNKMKAENLGIKLDSGKSEIINMTYKVNKDLYDANSIILGQKGNVAEISSYSPSSGKIDRDSAPGNLNIRELNDKTWYEDDTFAAPIADIELVPDNADDRTISGTVWEDKRNKEENGYSYGDGIKNSREETIKGLTTELVEKVMIPNYKADGKTVDSYTAYDFVIPTDKSLASLGNKSIKMATGFSSKKLTSKEGNYTFKCIPTGDYVVRFTYGDKEIETASKKAVDGYNKDGSKFYNGQDYKSSIYPGVDTIPSMLELSKYNNASENHSNIAVDSEVRRLQVIQKSREITNENGKVLASSYDDNYKNMINREEYIKGNNITNKEVLLRDYYMYADTPIIRLDDLNTENKYNLKNIDFALEERPLTELSLDKQIKEILITTSDGKTLMDAKYKIDYKIDSVGKVTAKVGLDNDNSIGTENLQALNRDSATTNGFRYINVDSEVLQGATITVTYQFAAINSGEVDYTSDELSKYDFNFDNACKDLSNKLVKFDSDKKATDFTIGKYLGNHYYYGKDKDGVADDKKVTTTVRELVDYVDNDVTFDALMNSTENRSWKTSNEEKLAGLIENTGRITDKNNVEYMTNGNLITSINDDSQNGRLIQKLEPIRDNNSYVPAATIELTVSKFVSSDSDDLQIDNIAEVIRYTNTVGRRDILTVSGNTNPAEAIAKGGKNKGPISEKMKYERDTSATETITLSPPTGSSIMVWRLQVAGAIALSMTIVAGGIILIKKKVLK